MIDVNEIEASHVFSKKTNHEKNPFRLHHESPTQQNRRRYLQNRQTI